MKSPKQAKEPGRAIARLRERGQALVVVLFVILALILLTVSLTNLTVDRSKSALIERLRADVLAAADAGLGMTMNEINEAAGLFDPATNQPVPSRSFNFRIGNTTVAVQAVDQGSDNADNNGDGVADDSSENGVIRLLSTATSDANAFQDGGAVVRQIEGYLRSSFHPLFYKVLYAANKDNVPGFRVVVGPTLESDGSASPVVSPVSGTDNADEFPGNTTYDIYFTEGDYIEGDVFVDGDLSLLGETNMYGDLDVTGTATGRPVDGRTSEGVPPITPPDLQAENYESRADWVVSVNDPNPDNTNFNEATYTGTNGGTPSFLRYGPFNSQTYFHMRNPGDFDNANFHFGAANEAVDFSSVAGPDGQFGTADDQQLFYIKGNVWIDTLGPIIFNFPTDQKIQLTVIVEGNLYTADGLVYNSQNNDQAVLFIAKSKDSERESFIDGSNGTPANGKYDAGETIINDNGQAGYQGPREGQGNIYYGELVSTFGGLTDGYYYAENNVHVLVDDAAPDPYGVFGFLSAGGIIDLGARRAGRSFQNYRAKYDDRLEKGQLNLPGIPANNGGGFRGLQLYAWREIPQGAN